MLHSSRVINHKMVLTPEMIVINDHSVSCWQNIIYEYVETNMLNMIYVVSGLLMAVKCKDKCLIWQYCISCKQGSQISDFFFFFLHFQVEARASRPQPSYAPVGHVLASDEATYDQMAASKSTTSQKGRTLIRKIHPGTCVHHSKPYF